MSAGVTAAAREVIAATDRLYGDHWREWATEPVATERTRGFSAALLELEEELLAKDARERRHARQAPPPPPRCVFGRLVAAYTRATYRDGG